MPSKKPTLTVRIPPELRELLEAHAKENDRSVSNMLTVLLKEFFDQQDVKKGTSSTFDTNRQITTQHTYTDDKIQQEKSRP